MAMRNSTLVASVALLAACSPRATQTAPGRPPAPDIASSEPAAKTPSPEPTRVVDDKPHGIVRELYPDGSTRREVGYDHGKRHGRTAELDAQGALVREMHYEDDRLEGLSRRWEGGRLVEEGTYQAGVKHGEWRYYAGGKTIRSERYEEGWMAEQCNFSGKRRRCERFARTRDLLRGCRVSLDAEQHKIVANQADFERVADCSAPPAIDWTRERVFVANFSSQSNASHHWSAVSKKRHVVLRLHAAFACQGARIALREMPVIMAVDTGGRRLRFEVVVAERRPCGQVR